jgi:hypothetical protein
MIHDSMALKSRKGIEVWNSQCQKLPNRSGQGYLLKIGDKPATFAEVLCGWRDDADFRTLFNSLLAEAPYTAFRWETPPVTTATQRRPFEFVLLNSPDLARQPEPDSFAKHFPNGSESGVVAFPNLGRDAVMVVPCPLVDASAYGHLAAFVRNAPEFQRHALWRAIGEAMQQRLNNVPVWLSTAGAGVSWLHVRLDDRPKYYGFDEYRQYP